MLKEELTKELLMGYEELTDHLKEKYGSAKYDYFHDESCRTKNKKVTRTDEGLQCHHIDEDKFGSLSSSVLAKRHPFACQKKDRLVYCNLIEHCLLHYKICLLHQTYPLIRPIDVKDFFVSGGTFLTSAIINDLFIKKGSALAFQQHYYEAIRDNYDDYIWMVTLFLKHIENNFQGEMDVKLEDTIENQHSSNVGEKVAFKDLEKGKYSEFLEWVIVEFSTGSKGTFYSSIYNDLVEKVSTCSEEDTYILEKWKQYATDLIDASYVFLDGSSKPLDTSYNTGKQIAVGEKLFDKRYGLGTITSVTPTRGDVLFTIDYDTKGEIHMSKSWFVNRNMLDFPKEEVNRSEGIHTFHVGDRVNHKVFGKGVVEIVEPLGKDQVLTVRFESAGKKTLLGLFSRLEKV